MKVFIIAAVFLVAGVFAHMPQMGEQFKKECADQEKIDAAELEKLRSGSLDNPSENLKCYSRCLVEKGGFFKDGMFVDEKVKEFFNSSPKKDALLASFEECKKIKGSNDCDTAFKGCTCMHKAHMATM
ncbi:Obp56h.2 family protein [Megaselia abdita]